MPVVYVGPIDALATVLQDELANEDALVAELTKHPAARAQSLKAGRALLKFALRRHGFLASGERLPPMVTSELGKPSLQWPDRVQTLAKGRQPWDFNLSHAHGLLALSLGQGPMGIDIECCTRKHFRPALINQLLSPPERLVCAALGLGLGDEKDVENVVNTSASPAPLSAEQLQVEVSNLGSLEVSPAWSHLVERGAALSAWQRQCSWWTQQWTVRECALKVLGKSIFAHEQLGFDLPRMQIKLAGIHQGTIHCYRVVTSNKLDVDFAGNRGERESSATGTVLLLPRASTEAEYVLSVFVPHGEKLWFNVWLNNTWHEISLTTACVYQLLPP